MEVEAQEAAEGEIMITRSQISAMNFTIECEDERHGMFCDGVRRVSRDADDVDAAVSMAHIDVIETCAAHGNEFDAAICQDVNGLSRNIVIDEGADCVVASGEFCGIGREFTLEIFDFEIIFFIFSIKKFAVIGFCIKDQYFHNVTSKRVAERSEPFARSSGWLGE